MTSTDPLTEEERAAVERFRFRRTTFDDAKVILALIDRLTPTGERLKVAERPYYYVENNTVWKRPIERPGEKPNTTRISVGFPVCKPTDYVAAADIAAALNAAEPASASQRQADRLTPSERRKAAEFEEVYASAKSQLDSVAANLEAAEAKVKELERRIAVVRAERGDIAGQCIGIADRLEAVSTENKRLREAVMDAVLVLGNESANDQVRLETAGHLQAALQDK